MSYLPIPHLFHAQLGPSIFKRCFKSYVSLPAYLFISLFLLLFVFMFFWFILTVFILFKFKKFHQASFHLIKGLNVCRKIQVLVNILTFGSFEDVPSHFWNAGIFANTWEKLSPVDSFHTLCWTKKNVNLQTNAQRGCHLFTFCLWYTSTLNISTIFTFMLIQAHSTVYLHVTENILMERNHGFNFQKSVKCCWATQNLS